MGRVDVRTAITSALTNAAIQYVGTVYSARPTVLNEQDYEQNLLGQAAAQSANGSSAVLVVNLPHDNRQRRALVGRKAVNDSRIYRTSIEVWFASTGGDAVAAQNDYDGIIDALVDLVRDDPVLSAPGTVWSAGEYSSGVLHQQAEPYTDQDGLTVFIPGVVEFDTWQWIAGNTP